MKKYIYPLVALLGIAVVSCSDDDYAPGPQSSGAYFDNATVAMHYFGLNDNSVEVTLNRTNSADAETVKLEVTDESGLFVVPNEAYFAAGAATSQLVITFDPTKLAMVDYPIVIKVADNQAYQYGATSFEFKVGFEPALRWEDFGVCLYRDDLISTFYNVGNPEYEVPIQRHMTTSGLYRLVNPYGEYYPYNEPGDYDEGEHYLVIHAENQNAVYGEICYTGCDWGYGEFIVYSQAGYYLDRGNSMTAVANNGLFGRLVNGVITFPAGTWLTGMMNYNNGGLYASNNSGMFRIVLPGYPVPED